MANVNAPFGLRPVRLITGSPYNGQVEQFETATTDAARLGNGDPVKLVGGSGPNGYPIVARAGATDKIDGVVIGVGIDSSQKSHYRETLTHRMLDVCLSNGVIFEVQEDSLVSSLAAVDVGKFIKLVVPDCDILTGNSLAVLDSDSKLTTALPLKIYKIADKPDNKLGTNAVYEVVVNGSNLFANILA